MGVRKKFKWRIPQNIILFHFISHQTEQSEGVPVMVRPAFTKLYWSDNSCRFWSLDLFPWILLTGRSQLHNEEDQQEIPRKRSCSFHGFIFLPRCVLIELPGFEMGSSAPATSALTFITWTTWFKMFSPFLRTHHFLLFEWNEFYEDTLDF